MRQIFRMVVVVSFFLLAGGLGQNGIAAERGKVTGGVAHAVPDWFKEGFLDIAEDAAEAAENNKHALLFMHVNGCPYCDKMFNEVFANDRAFIEKHFDSIAINIKGARTVTLAGGEELSERDYANRLRVLYTPTIIFLDKDAKPVYRINGFWNAKMFRAAAEYISSKSYKSMSLPAFVKAQAAQKKAQKSYAFRSHPQLEKITDFSKVTKPLLVLFEDKQCMGCDKLHDRNLARPEIREVLKGFVFTRLDADSEEPIIDVDGQKTTAKDWAVKLKLTARPGLVMFDKGKERQRIDGELYGFHFQYALRYVSGRHYEKYPTWLKYLSAETEKLLQKGQNVDIGDLPVAGR